MCVRPSGPRCATLRRRQHDVVHVLGSSWRALVVALGAAVGAGAHVVLAGDDGAAGTGVDGDQATVTYTASTEITGEPDPTTIVAVVAENGVWKVDQLDGSNLPEDTAD
jgi:hypothetical protein